MDPNENLKEQRRISRLLLGRTYLTQSEIDGYAQELAELVEALDEWMSKGGFPPDAWKKPQT